MTFPKSPAQQHHHRRRPELAAFEGRSLSGYQTKKSLANDGAGKTPTSSFMIPERRRRETMRLQNPGLERKHNPLSSFALGFR